MPMLAIADRRVLTTHDRRAWARCSVNYLVDRSGAFKAPDSAGLDAVNAWPSGPGHVATSIGVDIERLRLALDHFAADDDRFDAVQAGQVEHRFQQDRFHDGTQAARTGLASDRFARDGAQ